jgi:hypothetical protein
LDYVSRIDANRKWSYTDGIVLVGSELTSKTILNTVIEDIDIDPKEAPSLTAQRLLNTLEVRSSIQRARLTELSPELGFAQIGKTPAATSPQPLVGPSKRLHEITLADALNVAATMQGASVWEYEQYACKDKTSFRLGWAVK